MWQGRLQSEAQLSVNAASAGLALACAYSSSDEYEAEIIAARRAAGAYGPRRQRSAIVAFMLAAAACVMVFLAI